MHIKRFLGLLLLAALLAPAPAARAAVLFAGSEDVYFTCSPSGTCLTDISTFRPAWSRTALRAASVGATNDPPVSYWASPIFPANSTIWVHAQTGNFSGSTIVATASGAQFLRVLDSLGNAALLIRGTGVDSTVKISSRTAGGVFTDLVTCAATFPSTNTLDQVDFFVNYAVAGEVTLYVNGVAICDFTGNVTNGDGAATLDQIQFDTMHTTAAQTDWSEIIVATTDTRSMSALTAYPNAAGNLAQWSGSNACTAILNKTTIDDTTFIGASASGLSEKCAVYNTIPSGSYSVQAVTMAARALVGASGPQHFDFITGCGADQYSPDQAPTTSFSNFTFVETVNPCTAANWLISDLATLQIGWLSKP